MIDQELEVPYAKVRVELQRSGVPERRRQTVGRGSHALVVGSGGRTRRGCRAAGSELRAWSEAGQSCVARIPHQPAAVIPCTASIASSTRFAAIASL